MGGGESGPRLADERGKAHTDGAVGGVEGQPLEAEHRGPLVRGGDRVQVVAGEEAGRGQGDEHRHHRHHAQVRHEQGDQAKGGEAEPGEQQQVAARRVPLAQPAGQPRHEQADHRHRRTDEPVARLGQTDHPVVFTGQGDHQAQHVVKRHGKEDDGQGKGRAQDPAARPQGEQGRLAQQHRHRGLFSPRPVGLGFAQAQDRPERQQSEAQGQVDGQTHAQLRAHRVVPTEPGKHPVHQPVVVDRRAKGHGDDVAGVLGAHLPFQHPRPLGRHVVGNQGVVGERLVGTAGQGLGQAAEHPVGEKHPKNHPPVTQRHKGEQGHFHDHEHGGGHQQPFAAEHVGQGARGHLGQDNGHRPDGVKQGELFQGQAVVEKQDGEHRVVETGVEQHPKGHEQPDVGQRKG